MTGEGTSWHFNWQLSYFTVYLRGQEIGGKMTRSKVMVASTPGPLTFDLSS